MIIAGVEEAGRGPVIGPMVMSIVMMDQKDEFKLEILGVKDSKQLTPKKREELFSLIKETVKDFKIVIIEPGEIDRAVHSDESNLNWLEADKTVEFINSMKVDKVILDCPSNNISEYKEYIKNKINNKNIDLVVEHKADENHLIVGAASILAKVTRDKEIERLKRKYKVDFGSGYPSDPFTVQFLEKNYDKYPFFRKSWASWKRIAINKNQKKLFDY
jgi:ribonuclease HII